MAIAFVQYQANGTGSSPAITSQSASFDVKTTANSLIVVVTALYAYTPLTTGVTSVTDDANNNYQQAFFFTFPGVVQFPGTYVSGLGWPARIGSLFFAPNAAPTTQVTANFLNPGLNRVSSVEVLIHEYSGLASFSPLDKTSWNFATNVSVPDNITSNAKQTTQANELIFGFAMNVQNGLTQGTGFTLRTQDITGTILTEDKIVSVTGNYDASFSNTSGVTDTWYAMMATFSDTPVLNYQEVSLNAGGVVS